MDQRVQVGLEQLEANPRLGKSWGRCGLVCNQASLTWKGRHAVAVCQEALGLQFTAIFGPQHGYLGTAQDNMIETRHGQCRETGLKVFSLYSETREPTLAMLDEVDTLVVDLQIVGCRVYTFKATLAACLKAARKYGKRLVVLDRPNPLGGQVVEGRCLEESLLSFVGPYPMPMRHGLTTAEAALYFNSFIGAELEVVPLTHWEPTKDWLATGRPWVITSPNLPTLDPVFVYPGLVVFEACNVSEGRGTGLPFQLLGSPFCRRPDQLLKRLRDYLPDTPGVFLREAAFEPTSGKWMGKLCRGLQIHVVAPEKIQSFLFGLALLKSFWDVCGDGFAFKSPPYEYEFGTLPLKLILGAEDCLAQLENFDPADPYWQEGLATYCEQVRPLLLYPRQMVTL